MRGIIMQEMSVLGLIRGVKTQTRRLAKDRAAPLYRVGETLYVKEAIVRRADRDDGYATADYVADGEPTPLDTWPWSAMTLSPLFLPYGLRRFEVTIAEVRRQRLLEITDEDADAEGIDVMHGWLEDVDICRAAKLVPRCGPEDSRAWYLAAWDTIHKLYAPAASNPLIDAYTFTVARC